MFLLVQLLFLHSPFQILLSEAKYGEKKFLNYNMKLILL